MKFKIIFIAMILLFAGFVKAIPVPAGIDGIIFESEGITECAFGTEFSLCNLETGWCINGTTGSHTHSGRFSAAITGNDGDLIEIISWTATQNGSRTIALNGSMHAVNFLLSHYPPTIVSSPTEVAAEISSPNRFEFEESLTGEKEYIISEKMQEMHNTPSPKFLNTLSIVGEISRGVKEVTITNKANGKSTKDIVIKGINYYGQIEGMPGDQLVISYGKEKREIIAADLTVHNIKLPFSLSFYLLISLASTMVVTFGITIWVFKKR